MSLMSRPAAAVCLCCSFGRAKWKTGLPVTHHGTTAEQHHSTTVPELHGTTAPCVDEGGEVIKTLTDIFKHDLHLELLCYTLEEVRQVLFRPEAQRDVCNVNKYLTRSCRDLFQTCFF